MSADTTISTQDEDWGPFGRPLFDDPSARALSRVGVVDVGSNSVRMVVFDGAARSPAYFFNEKIMCGLGKGLHETGRLNPKGRERALAALGEPVPRRFVEDNLSCSRAGVLRGLHYQSAPHAQDKLVRCTRGAIFDVAVDYRVGSPHFGQWVGVELTADTGKQLLVPKGFLHGFLTLTPDTEVQYKCTDVYAPACDGAVRWDSCGIDWGFSGAPMLSAKDAAAQSLADFQSPFTFEG